MTKNHKLMIRHFCCRGDYYFIGFNTVLFHRLCHMLILFLKDAVQVLFSSAKLNVSIDFL